MENPFCGETKRDRSLAWPDRIVESLQVIAGTKTPRKRVCKEASDVQTSRRPTWFLSSMWEVQSTKHLNTIIGWKMEPLCLDTLGWIRINLSQSEEVVWSGWGDNDMCLQDENYFERKWMRIDHESDASSGDCARQLFVVTVRSWHQIRAVWPDSFRKESLKWQQK